VHSGIKGARHHHPGIRRVAPRAHVGFEDAAIDGLVTSVVSAGIAVITICWSLCEASPGDANFGAVAEHSIIAVRVFFTTADATLFHAANLAV